MDVPYMYGWAAATSVQRWPFAPNPKTCLSAPAGYPPASRCNHGGWLSVRDLEAATIWLTGLPAAGKTTLAYAVRDVLAERGDAVCVLDGDVLRKGLSSDLGLTPADRYEQVRSAG